MDDFIEKAGVWGTAIFALLGIVLCEIFYFNNADEVRLLFLLLLIPIGAILGAISFWILIGLAWLAVMATGVGIMIGLVVGAVAVVIMLLIWLYEVVVHTN